jgi:hypothetical protein
MMLAYAGAWLTPLWLGTGLVALALGRPRGGSAWAGTLGCGFLLGVLACAAAVGLLGRIDVGRIVPALAPPLLLFGAVAWWLAWRRPPAAVPVAGARMPGVLWILPLGLLVHAALMADEILLRPMYPWDAWAAWLMKPKAWMLAGHVDAFVAFDAWLADASGLLRTAPTAHYPEMLGRIALWFASAWGEWNGGVVGLAWLAAWSALLAGTFGQLRALGLEKGRAVVAAYALGSLPLINVHVALAGYADLWIASVLALACLAWVRWLERRERGALVLALALAASLPLIKLEGGIWLALLLASMVYERMPRPLRRIALWLAPLIGAGVVAAYLLQVPVLTPFLDGIGLSADVPALLRHAPSVIGAAAAGLFAEYNWHLFWFAVGLTLVLRRGNLAGAPALRVFGLFLLLGCGFLFALFVLTPAGRWAESHTAVNRLSLQIVPAMLAFAALLWRGPARVEGVVPGTPRVAVGAAATP